MVGTGHLFLRLMGCEYKNAGRRKASYIQQRSQFQLIIQCVSIQCVSMAGTISVSMGPLVSGIYKCTLLVELVLWCTFITCAYPSSQISMFGGIGERFRLCGWLLWWIALCMSHVIDQISTVWLVYACFQCCLCKVHHLCLSLETCVRLNVLIYCLYTFSDICQHLSFLLGW